MNIFVDESRGFVPTATADAWCAVVAYASPERDRAALERLVLSLRLECNAGKEAKLSHLTEERFRRFLHDLSGLHGVAFAVAIDMSTQTAEEILAHRDGQAERIEENIPRMRYPAPRQGLLELSQLIRSLPPQLYTQLVCQVQLFHRTVIGSTLFYCQRIPQTLGSFRWRVDRKGVALTGYERAFRTLLPALLQTRSEREPLPELEGGDYSHFERFVYKPEDIPRYLEEEYGRPPIESAANVGLIIREYFQYVDSARVAGVQVADLLASGLTRLLRGHFDDPRRMAAYLGANFLQRAKPAPPISLISLGKQERVVGGPAAQLARIMKRCAIPMIPGKS